MCDTSEEEMIQSEVTTDKAEDSSTVMTKVLEPVSTNKHKTSNAVEIFKIPDAPGEKKKRIVLEEDKYAEELEKIVERDFFPDLEKLKAQNAYLSAMENNDYHMLRELYSKYSLGRKTPRLNLVTTETPSTFETPIDIPRPTPDSNAESSPTHLPMETPADDAVSTSSKTSKSSAKNMSLNHYLDTYTSEDNQSFRDIMEESDRKHKLKYAWLYDAEIQHKETVDQSLALPSMEQQALEYKRPLNIDTWTYRNKNYIMYVPDGVAFTPEEEVELAKKKPEVVLNNTRYEENPFKNANAVDTSGKTHIFKVPEGKIGLDGKEIEADAPKINGFSLVKTPAPSPGVEESPFMTWGEIEGTPFRLDGSDTPVPSTPIKPFRMMNTSKRERLAIELAEKVSHRYRDKKQKAMEAARFGLQSPSPRPTSTLDRLTSMSPAAQKFAKSHLKSRIDTDKALRESYTPKRIGTPAGLKTPNTTITPRKTPKALTTPNITPSPSISGTSLTDNLLKLPLASSLKRPKAADFF
ncbi:unnamed protein product [Allacma fusca]|uniref:Uncharacterized protein n=1 Tax=Allacma fusca TaxID=39272 RepID=A0A8J2KS01_9HEXA|nr:unnamed protein product [Allacma fusca]